MTDPTPPAAPIPTAVLVPARPARWIWAIPIASLALVVALFATFVVKSGPVVTIRMTDGYGIKPTDVLRCRGIVVGQVEEVRLAERLDGVEVSVRLDPTARDVARAGSRFWVVRPQVDLTHVGGLETIAGPRYLAVAPGDGPPQQRFDALERPPVLESMEPDGLEILLTAQRRGGIREGIPILWRQVAVGTVLSAGLSSDAATVDVRAWIEPPYVSLVRENSRFWNASGADLQVGFKGLKLEVESLRSLVEGGIAFATPDAPGRPVKNGHRFLLHPRSEEEWLSWAPALPMGAELLPPGTTRPALVRVSTLRTGKGIFGRDRHRRGWALLVEGGLLGPPDLLRSPEEGTLEIEVEGERRVLAAGESQEARGLVLAPVQPPGADAWPASRIRAMEQPEDCVILGDPAGAPLPLGAGRLRRDDGRWRIDHSMPLVDDLHGAAVLARSDGALVGLLLVEDGLGVLVPLR